MHGASHAAQTAPPNPFPPAPKGQSRCPTSLRQPSLSTRVWSISSSSSSTSIPLEHFSSSCSTLSGVPCLLSEGTHRPEYSTRSATSHRRAESCSDRTIPRRKICSHPTGRIASTRHSPQADNGVLRPRRSPFRYDFSRLGKLILTDALRMFVETLLDVIA
jgi:hypothetical protein